MTGAEGATVLLVEDEPAVLDSFETMLDERYDVVKAVDGDDALARIKDEIDVIPLDRMMPGESGDEALLALGRSAGNRRRPCRRRCFPA